MTDVTVEIVVTEAVDADALVLPPTTAAADPVAKTATSTLIHRVAATATASEKTDTLAATVVDPTVLRENGIVTGAPTAEPTVVLIVVPIVVRTVVLTAEPSVEAAADGMTMRAAVVGKEIVTS